jgi:hypothetical protein
MMRTIPFIVGCACFVVALTASARASDVDKMTLVTFSQPIELPNVALPAGTYRFELADPSGDRMVVRVTNQNGTMCYGMFQTLPEPDRARQTSAVTFTKGRSGAPDSITAWFYPGDEMGHEFMYTDHQTFKG